MRPSTNKINSKKKLPPDAENPRQLDDNMIREVFSYFDFSSFFAARRVSRRWLILSEPWREEIIQISRSLPNYLNEKNINALLLEQQRNSSFNLLLKKVNSILRLIQIESLDNQIHMFMRFVEIINNNEQVPRDDSMLGIASIQLETLYQQVRIVALSEVRIDFTTWDKQIDGDLMRLSWNPSGNLSAVVRGLGRREMLDDTQINRTQHHFLTYIALIVANLRFVKVFHESSSQQSPHIYLGEIAIPVDVSALRQERTALEMENAAISRRIDRTRCCAGSLTLGMVGVYAVIVVLLITAERRNFSLTEKILMCIPSMIALIGFAARCYLRRSHSQLLRFAANEERAQVLRDLEHGARIAERREEDTSEAEQQDENDDRQPLLGNGMRHR